MWVKSNGWWWITHCYEIPEPEGHDVKVGSKAGQWRSNCEGHGKCRRRTSIWWQQLSVDHLSTIKVWWLIVPMLIKLMLMRSGRMILKMLLLISICNFLLMLMYRIFMQPLIPTARRLKTLKLGMKLMIIWKPMWLRGRICKVVMLSYGWVQMWLMES